MRIRDSSGNLVAIECDGCDRTIKPGPDIGKQGWVKEGRVESGPHGRYTYVNDWCPECACERNLHVGNNALPNV